MDHDLELQVLWRRAAEELGNSSLLSDVIVTVLLHLLPQSVEAESKVVDVLSRLESQAIPLQSKLVQRGLVNMITTDPSRSDGVPSVLGRRADTIFVGTVE
jgi:hypothetical protein